MFKTFITATALGLALTGAAAAATVTVDAAANSTTGGFGPAASFAVVAGQTYEVTAGLLDTWILGNNVPSSRETNADGLASYPDYTQGGLTALYGTLVGNFDFDTSFFVLGTSAVFTAAADGFLYLYNFDSNSGDNSGEIAVTISAVPVPAGGLLLLTALGGVAALRRRKTA